MTATAPTAAEEREVKTSRSSGAAALIFKIIVMGLIDVVGIWAVIQVFDARWWGAVAFLVLALAALNYAYFTRGLPEDVPSSVELRWRPGVSFRPRSRSECCSRVRHSGRRHAVRGMCGGRVGVGGR